MKKAKIGLLGKIVIAIAIGIGIGYIAPEWLARLCVTFNEVFSQFLGFIIPLIILGFVAPAIADLGNRAGKMLIVTAAIAYAATLLSGFGTFFTGDWLFPGLVTAMPISGAATAETVKPWFSMPIPAIMPVMTALVFAFMLGLGAAYIKGDALRKGINEFRSIVTLTINNAVIPLLPIYIFCTFVNMTYIGQVGAIISTFLKIIVISFSYCMWFCFSCNIVSQHVSHERTR